MTEGQSRRRIGTGMKPRGKKQVKPQKEKNSMTEQSTTEGHETLLQGAVLDPQEGNETPGNLEPENGENGPQNLEEKEPMVAQDAGLEAALEESAAAVDEPQFKTQPIPGREFSDLGVPTEEELARSVFEDGKTQAPADLKGSSELKNQADVVIEDGKVTKSRDSQPLIVAKGSIDREKLEEIRSNPGQISFTPSGVGLQPDGSLKVILTIQEGQVESVKSYAESDGTGGVSVEQWVSERFFEFLEAYGAPAQRR